MPRKHGPFRKCAGGSGRKLFLSLPVFRLLLYFSSFGVNCFGQLWVRAII